MLCDCDNLPQNSEMLMKQGRSIKGLMWVNVNYNMALDSIIYFLTCLLILQTMLFFFYIYIWEGVKFLEFSVGSPDRAREWHVNYPLLVTSIHVSSVARDKWYLDQFTLQRVSSFWINPICRPIKGKIYFIALPNLRKSHITF